MTEEEPVDVLIVDGQRPFRSPGISGIEATRRIMASRPDTTVVLLSTYAAAELPPDATTCGAATYLNKEDLTPGTLRALR